MKEYQDLIGKIIIAAAIIIAAVMLVLGLGADKAITIGGVAISAGEMLR